MYNSYKIGGEDAYCVKTKNIINVKQYVTDKKGYEVAGILDIKELTKNRRCVKTFPILTLK